MSLSMVFLLFMLSTTLVSASSMEELPGVEVDESVLALRRSRQLVEDLQKPAEANQEKGEQNGWIAPSIGEQLARDPVLLGMGLGAIFVPTMTEERLEPEVLITDSFGEKEWRGRTGTRIMLEAGTYTVRIGSGSMRQKMKFSTVVEEGHTTVVEPRWAGLVVETLLDNGDLVDEEYEIWELHSAESYGRGYGATPEKQSDIRTWFLPPGIYRLGRVGEDPGSPINFVTVQLNEGRLTHMELVFDPLTGNLISGGVRAVRPQRQGDSYWRFGMRLGGTISYGAKVSKIGTQNNVWNVLTDLRARASFDRTTYFGITELISRNNFQWTSDDNGDTQMRSLADNLQLQTAWVRRLTPWLGPYMRANAKSHLLRQDFTHPEGDTVWVTNRQGDTVRVLTEGENMNVQPTFFPLRVGEGLGVNLDLLRLHAMELTAQSGVALRQNFLYNVLVPRNPTETLWGKEPNQFSYGLENALMARVRLGRALTLDLVGELYLPNFRPSMFQIEEFTFDIRLALTRNIELSYLQRFLDHQATGLGVGESGQRFESNNVVQLRFFLNY